MPILDKICVSWPRSFGKTVKIKKRENLPQGWLALINLTTTNLVGGAVYAAVQCLACSLRGRRGGHLGSLLEPSNRGKKQPGATLSGQWTLGNEEKMWGQQRRHDQVLGENLCERGATLGCAQSTERRGETQFPVSPLFGIIVEVSPKKLQDMLLHP